VRYTPLSDDFLESSGGKVLQILYECLQRLSGISISKCILDDKSQHSLQICEALRISERRTEAIAKLNSDIRNFTFFSEMGMGG
jgi:hypothetical protein